MSVKPVPDGYHTATPYLIVEGAAAAIDFYRRAFGATEIMRMDAGDRIGHAGSSKVEANHARSTADPTHPPCAAMFFMLKLPPYCCAAFCGAPAITTFLDRPRLADLLQWWSTSP